MSKPSTIFLATIFTMNLLACSQPTVAPTTTQPTPTYTTTSHVLAEPLPNKKVKISITAKEKSLFIVNCNEHITVALVEIGKTVPVWGGTSDACRSTDIVIPQGATLSFITTINDETQPLDVTKTYQAQIFHLGYNPQVTTKRISTADITSNPFKLLP